MTMQSVIAKPARAARVGATRDFRHRLLVLGVLLLPIVPAAAQTPDPAAPTESREEAELRQQLQVMEQAFGQAVSLGAQRFEQELPPFAPGGVLAGPIQVRGFRLAGHGFFFDVEYPVLRRSILWSMQMLDPFELSMNAALQTLRRRLEQMADAPGRPSFEQALRQIEEVYQAAPAALGVRPAPPTAPRPLVVDPPARQADAPPVDPQQLYFDALRSSLANAMVTYGRSATALDEGEWLSVGARDIRGLSGRGGTIRLRIRGRDLAALRDGRLTTEEALARVEVPRF